MTPYYEQAGITIYHGDCRELLRSFQPDLLLADPPYGVPRLLRGGGGAALTRLAHCERPRRRSNEAVVGNDQAFDPSHMLAFARVILWGANHYSDKVSPASRWLIWDKREGQTSDNNADCEMAWTNLGGPARLYKQLWRGMVMRGEENGRSRFHPTQKPVALMRWCIEQAKLRPNSLIVDPYIGSGTTLVAAYRTGHRAVGIEIEERYCEIAAKRLEQEILPLEQPA